MGLGGLLGGRFLLLTHTGRRSGRPRQVVLEIVGRHQPSGGFLVASASLLRAIGQGVDGSDAAYERVGSDPEQGIPLVALVPVATPRCMKRPSRPKSLTSTWP